MRSKDVNRYLKQKSENSCILRIPCDLSVTTRTLQIPSVAAIVIVFREIPSNPHNQRFVAATLSKCIESGKSVFAKITRINNQVCYEEVIEHAKKYLKGTDIPVIADMPDYYKEEMLGLEIKAKLLN